MNTSENGHEIIDIEPTGALVPVREQILAPLALEDMSVFLYETNFGGKKGQDFTFEGIKTLGLNNGISTGDVRIEFLNDEKTEALFYCTATDRNGDTSGVVVQQNKKAITAGKAHESSIIQAQKACGQAYTENAETLGMSKKQAFSIAVEAFGDSDFWEVSEWETLRKALQDPENFREHFNGETDETSHSSP